MSGVNLGRGSPRVLQVKETIANERDCNLGRSEFDIDPVRRRGSAANRFASCFPSGGKMRELGQLTNKYQDVAQSGEHAAAVED